MSETTWWGVWCERDGGQGFWRNVRGTGEPLQTTETEALRTAAAANEFQETRKDSLGWRYSARPYKAPASPT